VKEGYRVLLWGRPNVGKSSILNLLLGRERAIVTEVSGTTRDLIEEPALLGGVHFVFCDCAGIAETADKVEQIGIQLAKQRIAWADLVLCVVDACDQSGDWQAVLRFLEGKAKKIWMIANKIDLNPGAIGTVYGDSTTCRQNFYLCALSGDGMDSLTEALIAEVAETLADQAQASQVVTNERHRDCLSRAEAALARCTRAAGDKLPLEIISIELRQALTALEELIGATTTEDILGRIFSRFCIGK
jgi:tRNA modification GTPase